MSIINWLVVQGFVFVFCVAGGVLGSDNPVLRAWSGKRLCIVCHARPHLYIYNSRYINCIDRLGSR